MTPLKIVSWNIWGGMHIDEIIERLRETNADVIGLQEVLQNEDGIDNGAERIAEALGYDFVFGSTKTLTPDISHLLKEHGITEKKEWGNALLSRTPFLSHETHVLSREKARTAIQGVIRVGESEVSLFSTHLVYGDEFIETCLEQAEKLLTVVPERHGIVMGDFNSTPESPVIARVLRQLTCPGNDFGEATFSDESAHIDYIFTTKDMPQRTTTILPSHASDHFAVMTEVEMR